MPNLQPNPRRRRALLLMGWSLVAALLVVLFARTVLPVDRHRPDFAMLYRSSHVFWTGGNPYDRDDMRDAHAELPGMPPISFPDIEHDTFYPPATPAAFGPALAVPYPIAATTWTLARLALLALAVVLLTQWAQRSLTPAGLLPVALAAVGLFAMSTDFRQGQLGLPVTAAAAWALLRLDRAPHRAADLLAGLTLGYLTALKPQLAGLFALYALARHRPMLAAPAVALPLLILTGSILALQAQGHPWLADLRHTLELHRQPGGAIDPSPTGPYAYQLINLHAPLRALTHHAGLVTLAVTALGVALLALGTRRAWPALKPTNDPTDRAATLAALLVPITLLGVYHRGYDAVLLLIVAAWLARTAARRDTAWWVALACLLVFVTPGGTLWHVIEQRQGFHAPAPLRYLNNLLLPVMATAILCHNIPQKPEPEPLSRVSGGGAERSEAEGAGRPVPHPTP